VKRFCSSTNHLVKRRGVKLREAFLAYPPARPHGRLTNPGSASWKIQDEFQL